VSIAVQYKQITVGGGNYYFNRFFLLPAAKHSGVNLSNAQDDGRKSRWFAQAAARWLSQ